LEEYLHTVYEPDCEYLDGELVERNVGEIPHADLQGLICRYVLNRRKLWQVYSLVEARVRIREKRYLIPDICVVRGERPAGRVITSPPFIWIEILSPEDRPLRVQRKIHEILDFGCPWIWLIDPDTFESRVYTKNSDFVPEDGVLRIPDTEIVIPLREIED
jgi:Uma2 family endonuclease